MARCCKIASVGRVISVMRSIRTGATPNWIIAARLDQVTNPISGFSVEERFQGFQDTFRIYRCGLDEKIEIFCCARAGVIGEGVGATTYKIVYVGDIL